MSDLHPLNPADTTSRTYEGTANTIEVGSKARNRTPFDHEREAIEEIKGSLKHQGEFVSNYDLHDPRTNQYLECDLIYIDQCGVSVIELKHWRGRIRVDPWQWVIDDVSYRADPHRSNVYKCKVLRSVVERLLPTFPSPWVESIVVLTNPDAIVEGAQHYDTDRHNPTFSDIATAVKYLKRRLDSPTKLLTQAQVGTIAKRLKGAAEGPRRKTLGLPGYETLENRTSNPNTPELLVRPLENQLHRVQRLRFFLPDPNCDAAARAEQRTKALNGLKALEQVGDHPGILKVWSVPNDEGLVIEACHWSDEGTLEDTLVRETRFEIDRAVSIIRSILEALAAVHAQGIVHRDLQPRNILMVRSKPVLMNFDLSYVPEDNRLTVFPDSEHIKASPYMAPELYLGQDISEATDIFSTGVIFYELLTGHKPFKHSMNLQDGNGRIRSELRGGLAQLGVPESLIDIILPMMHFERLKRPQEAADGLEALEAFVSESRESLSELPYNRQLEPGDISGVYEIEELEGKGRDSFVYRAKQAGGRTVALKLFNHEVPQERIYNERDSITRVASPYVVRCQTIGNWDDGRLFLVLDYVEGASLRDGIQNGQVPDLQTFRKVTQRLMEALSIMHKDPARDTPLLHNDIKPDNVLVTQTSVPVLIDFGTACMPRSGAYMGTAGYVAPDLVDGVERDFCEDGDLFALGATLFEWLCGIKPYEGVPTTGAEPRPARELRSDIPESLSDWLRTALQPMRKDRFKDVQSMKAAFEGLQELWEANGAKLPATEELKEALPKIEPEPSAPFSPFVTYLNTLHNATAGNENALAESQALSKFFGRIHVPVRVTEFIEKRLLLSGGSSVILTGHAGDGKSTIALELYKRLKKVDMLIALDKPLQPSETITLSSGDRIHIVKDMSELEGKTRSETILKALRANSGQDRWLIVSNTGTLLNSFEKAAEKLSVNRADLQNKLLSCLEAAEPKEFDFGGTQFTIVNLARLDSVDTAMTLLHKLVDDSLWAVCEHCEYAEQCPIYMNVRCLQNAPDSTIPRIKWVYRRLHSYGRRLTMRQMTAHLAYAITSGLSCLEIRAKASSELAFSSPDYLFSDRFFGFAGNRLDPHAALLTAVEHIILLELGSRPFPDLEHRLWELDSMEAAIPEPLRAWFRVLVNRVVRDRSRQEDVPELSRTRQQIRRMMYFFGDLPAGMQDSFLQHFIDSPGLIQMERFMADSNGFKAIQKRKLKGIILRVLQEQFTGLPLPDRAEVSHLFIGLKRANEEIRQSVQLVLAKIPVDNFSLEIEPGSPVIGNRSVNLKLVESRSGESLIFDLPFLDFVLMREKGEVGQRINPAFRDRIERFKAGLLPHYGLDELELLQLAHDGSFKTVRFIVEGSKMQVM